MGDNAHRASGLEEAYSSDEPIVKSSNEPCILYENAGSLRGKVPAHKAVRLVKPRHPLATSGSKVFFKYTEEHYTEESVPEIFTNRDGKGRACRYATNFLVYNRRGERLVPLESLDNTSSKNGNPVLYCQLMSIACIDQGTDVRGVGKKRHRRKHHNTDVVGSELPEDLPYPIRIPLVGWQIEYGPSPSNAPHIWLISETEGYYRLEVPAGRYLHTYQSAKDKMEVCARLFKTLQDNTQTALEDIIASTVDEPPGSHWNDPNHPAAAYSPTEDKRELPRTSWNTNFLIPNFRRIDFISLGGFILKEAELFATFLFGPQASEREKSQLLQAPALQQLRAEVASLMMQAELEQSKRDGGARMMQQPSFMSYDSPYGAPGGQHHMAAQMYSPPNAGKTLMLGASQSGSPGGYPGMDMMQPPPFPMGYSHVQPWPMMNAFPYRTELHISHGKILGRWYELTEEEQRKRWPFTGTGLEQVAVGHVTEDTNFVQPVVPQSIPSPFIEQSQYPPFPNRLQSMPPPAMNPALMMMPPGQCVKDESQMGMGYYPRVVMG